MSLSEFTACTVCGSNKIPELNGYEAAYLCKCSNCSFVFAKKIPSEGELIAHYETYPRTNTISAITIKRYNELLDSLEKFRKSNNLIDVGCGDGFFLETAKQRNWNVYGTEYTDHALKICKDKGIHMHQGKLDANNYAPDFFDVITSFEVIEHINNPREELQQFSKILRTGGAVYVTTPNFNSVSRFTLKNKWNVIEYPEHLSYYTQKTLSYLFRSANFSIDSFQTTGISLSRFQKSIGQATTSKPTGVSKDEELRNKTETKLFYKLAKKLLNTMLTMLRAGDTLKGMFIKK
ncbi:MAG: class I SAM-dependent methyltransferase [Bacteroidetes bacterium]|nr:class I SAM-dependent methyltransferase [Bacteroidota bacterium]MBK9670954.1 class I SAM-dependent methyltransferase [Bacteroidota bacterium]MBP6413925.1 class I SAM-dependent methyltransferase [Bacteroidia bacterium]